MNDDIMMMRFDDDPIFNMDQAVPKLTVKVATDIESVRETILKSQYWTTKQGRRLAISAMDLSHIENVINAQRRSLVKVDDEIKSIGQILTADPSRLEYHMASLASLTTAQIGLEASIQRFMNEMDKRMAGTDLKRNVRGSIILVEDPVTDHPVDTIAKDSENGND